MRGIYKKRKKINWRQFYDSSGWAIAKVLNCSIVGIVNKQLRELPPDPNEPVYLCAAVTVIKAATVVERAGQDPNWFVARYDNVAWLIIDVANDRWSYVQDNKVVNFPPRYRFTHEHKSVIYQAAKGFVETMVNEANDG